MQYMDQSGLYAMEEVLQGLVQKGVTILFVNLLAHPRYLMEGIEIIPELVPEDQIFESFRLCMHWVQENNPIPEKLKNSTFVPGHSLIRGIPGKTVICMIDQLKKHIAEVQDFNTENPDAIEAFRIKYLGKKGLLNDFFKALKDTPKEEKRAFGRTGQ